MVDAKSVENPASKNYVGERKPFIIPNQQVIRQDVLDFQAQSVLDRYGRIRDIVSVDIKGDPRVEIEDTIQISDSDSGLSNERFWVNKISHRATPALATTVLRLDPYKPTPSFKSPTEPTSPTSLVSGFNVSRTDGKNLDDSNWANNYYIPWTDGFNNDLEGTFSAALTDQRGDPVYLKIQFDLFASSIVTLQIKNVVTNEVVATIFSDQYLSYGHYEKLWDGIAYGKGTITHFPISPDQNYGDWVKAQERLDPIKGDGETALQQAGYFFVELAFRPVDTPTDRDVAIASNSDNSSNYVKSVIVAGQGTATLTNNHTTHGGGTAFGDRNDVYLDEYAGTGPPVGVRVNLTVDNNPVKIILGGWLDTHVLVTSGDDQGAGTQYYVYRGKVLPESYDKGFHFYYGTDTSTNPWETDILTAETEFLATGSYAFVLDPHNMPLNVDDNVPVLGKVLESRAFGSEFVTLRELEPDKIPFADRTFTYRDNYLAHISGMFPNRQVSVGVYYRPEIKVIDAAGRVVVGTSAAPRRLENELYGTGNSHCVFPSGITGQSAGTWAQTRGLGNGVTGDLSTVHFTCAGSPTYVYD